MFLFFGRRAFEKLYRRTVLGKAWIFLAAAGASGGAGDRVRRAAAGGGTAKVPYFLFMSVGTAAWELFGSS
jgi:ABC-type polysaccharide/polyol phosphate export permease